MLDDELAKEPIAGRQFSTAIERLEAYAELLDCCSKVAGEYRLARKPLADIAAESNLQTFGIPYPDKSDDHPQTKDTRNKCWAFWREWAERVGQIMRDLDLASFPKSFPKQPNNAELEVAIEILDAATSSDSERLDRAFRLARRHAGTLRDLDSEFFRVTGCAFDEWRSRNDAGFRQTIIDKCRALGLPDNAPHDPEVWNSADHVTHSTIAALLPVRRGQRAPASSDSAATNADIPFQLPIDQRLTPLTAPKDTPHELAAAFEGVTRAIRLAIELVFEPPKLFDDFVPVARELSDALAKARQAYGTVETCILSVAPDAGCRFKAGLEWVSTVNDRAGLLPLRIHRMEDVNAVLRMGLPALHASTLINDMRVQLARAIVARAGLNATAQPDTITPRPENAVSLKALAARIDIANTSSPEYRRLHLDPIPEWPEIRYACQELFDTAIVGPLEVRRLIDKVRFECQVPLAADLPLTDVMTYIPTLLLSRKLPTPIQVDGKAAPEKLDIPGVPPVGVEPPDATELSSTSASRLPRCQTVAHSQYLSAINELGNVTHRAAYAWVEENSDDEDELPSLETWTRYVRAVQRATGTQKNSPRKARPHGPSVAKASDV